MWWERFVKLVSLSLNGKVCCFSVFQDLSARYDALRFLAGDAGLSDALRTPEVQQYLGNDYVLLIIIENFDICYFIMHSLMDLIC